MLLEELFNEFQASINEFFPQLVYDKNEIKTNFMKRFSKYNGTSKKIIEFLPNIKDDDIRLLNIIEKFKSTLSNKYSDVNVGFDGISYLKPYRSKDINRLNVLMSAEVAQTIANPILGCVIKYDDNFYDTADRVLSSIKKSVPKVNINDTIRKRKNSSSGSFFGISTHDFYMRLFNIFKHNVLSQGWDYINKQCDSSREIFTQPLTRRMDKAPKVYFDMTTKGEIEEITRELDSSYNNLKKYKLVTSRHRFVNNVSEIERMFHLFYNLVSDSIKNNYACSLTYDRDYINNICDKFCNVVDYYDLNAYIPVGTDGSAFDKHIPEPLMHKLESFYSSYYYNKPFLSNFRCRKRLIFPNDKGEAINYNDIITNLQSYLFAHNIDPKVNENITKLLDKYKTILNLDSGKSSVSFDGKLSRVISEIVILEKIFNKKLSEDEIDLFLNNKLLIKLDMINKNVIKEYKDFINELNKGNEDNMSDIERFLLKSSIKFEDCQEFVFRFNNSSDDNLAFMNRWFANLYLYIILQNNKKQQSLKTFDDITNIVNLSFLPVDLDGEYLSMVFVREEKNNNIRFTHNSMRRFASMLKPEHGVKLKDGYKDFKLGLTSRIEMFKECVDGLENFDILNNLFIEEFDDNLVNLVDKLIVQVQLSQSELPEHLKASLTEAEKLLLTNSDYIYYKIDPNDIRPELLDYLFFNIDKNDLLEILNKLNVDFELLTDQEILELVERRKELDNY